jgi:cupin 2 domain-containing protein
MDAGNLFVTTDVPRTGELSTVLLKHRNLVVERIASSASTRPTEYKQTQDEWVVLLRGEATLRVDGAARDMKPGDYVFLPGMASHVLERVSQGALWLAVHLHPEPAL